ncbi:Mannan endo-1,6-alpha-mannosidase DCW1 [Fusarium oxysporum f. sp. albedinis]|nr:Mannan endo-1,6-alpha-mannosidase DCW1 [Fusarium oxysporum f. sp. albedinis]
MESVKRDNRPSAWLNCFQQAESEYTNQVIEASQHQTFRDGGVSYCRLETNRRSTAAHAAHLEWWAPLTKPDPEIMTPALAGLPRAEEGH